MKTIKHYIFRMINKLVSPFYGTWIWRYQPFKWINSIYKRTLKNHINLVNTKFGFEMELSVGKYIDDEIIHKWVWEENISNLIKDNLKEWDVFLDLGANIGYDSLLASKRVWESGKVIAFEPNKNNFEKFQRNIEINGFTNIQAYKLWVGKEKSHFELFYDECNPGATSLIKRENHSCKWTEMIEVVKMDDFLHNIKIDFIKMDIEGFEYNAILWMKQIFSDNKDIKLLFEFSPIIYKKIDSDYRSYSIRILSTLTEFWFHLFHIESDGALTWIKDFQQYFEIVDKIWQSDIFCTKR